MTILNRDFYPKIFTSFENVGTPHWTMPTFNTLTQGNVTFSIRDFEDADYWFIEIFNGNSFQSYPIETVVPEEILRKIWNKEVFLLLSNTHETYHNIVTGIYRDLIVRASIPVEQIILLTESADILAEVELVSNQYNLPQFKVEWIRSFEFNAKNQYIHSFTKQDIVILEDKHYDKKFLSFNRHMMTHGRLHRASLIALLCSMNILDYGYVSAGLYEHSPTWDELLCELKTFHADNTEITNHLIENQQKILNIGKLSVDANYETVNVRDNAYLLSSTTQFYANSYFSVVTETNCFAKGIMIGDLTPPGRLLSEKTFKTIAQKHPFITVAPANTLSLLKDLGYKTFSPWIDESYDNERNESARMLMIAKEVKRLCELTPEQLTDFLNNVREICDHNFNTLLNKTSWTTKLN